MSPATATPKRNPQQSIKAATAEAARRWREWATTMAEGHELAVEPREIIEAAALLSYRDPGVALNTDANIVLQVRNLEEQAARYRKTVKDAHAAEGGIDAIRRRIGELRAEATRLERLTLRQEFMSAGRLAGEASRLRAAHPHLFHDPRENGPTAKKRRGDK